MMIRAIIYIVLKQFKFVCDTLCSLYSNGQNKSITYLAKNSDREPNEIQIVEYYPRMERSGKLKATHIQVDFEGETNGIIISRPEWMWGAEMGFNEHGVAIGNEALFTKGRHNEAGLLGMDLLRLSLEKGADARTATDVIINYLEQYGQGGSNSRTSKYYYDNSFIVSDHKESYILETVGKEWRRTKVSQFASISNVLSEDVIFSERNESKGFTPSNNLFMSMMGKGTERQRETRDALTKMRSHASIEEIMKVMRMHKKSQYSPFSGSNEDVCMHAGPLSRRNQTVNSMIAEIGKDFIIGWFTFSSNPCLSLYKPIIFQGDFVGSTSYDRKYWINNEKIHRKLLFASAEIFSDLSNKIDSMQKRVLELVDPIRSRMLKGKVITEYDANSLYNEIYEADRIITSSFKRGSDNISTGVPMTYRMWWDKTNKQMPS